MTALKLIVTGALLALLTATPSALASLPPITDGTGPILPTGPSPSAQPRETGDVVFRFDPEHLGGPSRLDGTVIVNPGATSADFRVDAAPADSTYTVTVRRHSPDERIDALGPGQLISSETGRGNAGSFSLDLPPAGALLTVRVSTVSPSSKRTLSGTVQVLTPSCQLLYPIGRDQLPTANVCATGSGKLHPAPDPGKPVGALEQAVAAYTSGKPVAPGGNAPDTVTPGVPQCPDPPPTGGSSDCLALSRYPSGTAKGIIMVIAGGGWQSSEQLARDINGAESGPAAPSARWQANGYVATTVELRPGAAGATDAVAWFDGLRALADQIDPAMPVCTLGMSSGAHFALMTAYFRPNVSCVIGEAPPTNLLPEALPPYTANLAMATFTPDRGALQFWSPAYHPSSSYQMPIILGHAKDDTIVPAFHTSGFAASRPSVSYSLFDSAPPPPGGSGIAFTHVAGVNAIQLNTHRFYETYIPPTYP